ncbi:nucleoside-diphosphate sugar epimerase [Candidatus Pacearchaeota archaeon]|nr:nucleoside-diphosphate sugar epimerase [Candidatus Pacearchaeota archaeon]|tara:strand:- start:3027 stop:4079 length:1053 start_codon:yes stop_codon:yes gene_type:complete
MDYLNPELRNLKNEIDSIRVDVEKLKYQNKQKKLKFLITGASGHVGSALIQEYVKREDIELIRILDNLSTERYCSLFDLPKTHVKVEFIEGDIGDLELLKKVMVGIDVVIHLASMTNAPETIDKPEECKKVNLIGTQNVLNAAIDAGVKKFIFPSSTSVYGEAAGVVDENTAMEDLNPSSPYAVYKLESEKIVQDANGKNGIQTFVLRKGTIYGKSIGMRFHTAVNKFVWLACMNKPLTLWDSALSSKRPYLGLSDAIRAYEFVEKHGKPGELYNVLTKNYTVNEIVEAIKKHKSDLKVTITKSPLLNQKSYEVACDKFGRLGFEYKDDLGEFLGEEISLLGGVDNSGVG